ncbi:MAG: DUF2029 domain-containing protein [Flavobacterium sp.]|nr:DUF2029 domain-containing protein [Flavobacterium sp.]
MIVYIKKILTLPFFNQKKYSILLWLALAVFSALKLFLTFDKTRYNNYLIYKNVYYNTVKQVSLYAENPALFLDSNHYGPIFSIIIAPFAILPDGFGMVLWNIFNAGFLIWAISKLPIQQSKINLIFWICAHELLTSLLSLQFNPLMTSIIILSFVFIHNKKEFWAALFIIIGTYVKLYGIVGLAFFFFTKNKIKFIAALLFWSIVLFVLPMLISSPEFICKSYLEWFDSLVHKNDLNGSLTSMQDISVMGMFRRILQNPNLSNIPFLIIGLIAFAVPYTKYKLYDNLQYRLLLLASVLLFTVIFSTGSESPTYIIAFVGVAIWYVIKQKPISNLDVFLFVLAMILTSFSPSDLMPGYIRNNFIKPYALKALPCVLIWIKIVYEMLVIDTTKVINSHKKVDNE